MGLSPSPSSPSFFTVCSCAEENSWDTECTPDRSLCCWCNNLLTFMTTGAVRPTLCWSWKDAHGNTEVNRIMCRIKTFPSITQPSAWVPHHCLRLNTMGFMLDWLSHLMCNDSIVWEPKVVPWWMTELVKPTHPSIDKVGHGGDLCPSAFSFPTKATPETIWTSYCLCPLSRLYQALSVEASTYRDIYKCSSLWTKHISGLSLTFDIFIRFDGRVLFLDM